MVGTDDARVAPVAWTRYGAEAYDALRATVAEAKRGDPLAPVTVLVPSNSAGSRRDGRSPTGSASRRRGRVVGAHGRPAGRTDRRACAGGVGAPAGDRPCAGGGLAAGLAEAPGVFAPVAGHRRRSGRWWRPSGAARRRCRGAGRDRRQRGADRRRSRAAASAGRRRSSPRILTTRDLRETATALARRARAGRRDRRCGAVPSAGSAARRGRAAAAACRGRRRAHHRRTHRRRASGRRGPAVAGGSPRSQQSGRRSSPRSRSGAACVGRRRRGPLCRPAGHRPAARHARTPDRGALRRGPAVCAAAGRAPGRRRGSSQRHRSPADHRADAGPDPARRCWRCRTTAGGGTRCSPCSPRRRYAMRTGGGCPPPAGTGYPGWPAWSAAATGRRGWPGTRPRSGMPPGSSVRPTRRARLDRKAGAGRRRGRCAAGVRRGPAGPPGSGSKPGHVAGAGRLGCRHIPGLVGDLEVEPWLPEDEARAAEKVQRVLSGLAGLGAIEATADLTALRPTLELELADDLPRHGPFGDGVLVAPLSDAIGLDVDVVFVVGLADDLVPGRLRRGRAAAGAGPRAHRRAVAALARSARPAAPAPARRVRGGTGVHRVVPARRPAPDQQPAAVAVAAAVAAGAVRSAAAWRRPRWDR